MKVYAVLLIAALCATAISAQEPQQQTWREKLLTKAKELQAKAEEKKEQGLARLKEIDGKLQAKLKEIQEKVGPAIDSAKEKVIEKGKADIEETIKQLKALDDKLSAMQMQNIAIQLPL